MNRCGGQREIARRPEQRAAKLTLTLAEGRPPSGRYFIRNRKIFDFES